MPNTAVYGYSHQLGIDTANPITQAFQFEMTTMGADQEMSDNNGIRGTTARKSGNVLPGRRKASGQLVVLPTAFEAALHLPWIMGGTPTGSGTVTYPLSDTCPTRNFVLNQKTTGYTSTRYTSVAVDKFNLKASHEGEQKVNWTLDLVGIDEIPSGTAFPVLTPPLDVTTFQFLFYMAAFTINGHTYNAKEIDFNWDFRLDKERFFNSQTLTQLNRTDRHVTAKFTIPWTDAFTDYGVGENPSSLQTPPGRTVIATGAPAITAVTVFTYGNAVLTITHNNLVAPRKPRRVTRGEEVFAEFECIALASEGSSGVLESVVTLNPGP